MGKSNHPIHQKGPCHTHPREGNEDPQRDTESSGWELAQTMDPKGVNNFNQDSNGKLTTTGLGYPKCNYCKLPKHSRQTCVFRLKDLQNNINRTYHPQKGFLTEQDAKRYNPPQKRQKSPMSSRLAKELDNTGNPRFWQTRDGHIIYSIDNEPQCSYCGIPSHCYTEPHTPWGYVCPKNMDQKIPRVYITIFNQTCRRGQNND